MRKKNKQVLGNFLSEQCDQIGLPFNHLGNKFTFTKIVQIFGKILGYFEKRKF